MVVGPLCGQGSMGPMKCFIVRYRCLQDAVELCESWLHAETNRHRFVAFYGETLIWCLVNEPHDGWNVIISGVYVSCLHTNDVCVVCGAFGIWYVWQFYGVPRHGLVNNMAFCSWYVILFNHSWRLCQIYPVLSGTACITTEVFDTGIDFVMFAWSVSEEAGICKHPQHKGWLKSL